MEDQSVPLVIAGAEYWNPYLDVFSPAVDCARSSPEAQGSRLTKAEKP